MLRELTVDDAPRLYAAVDANRAYLREWLPWLDSQQGPADSLEFIKNCREKSKQGTGLTLGIELQGELVGVVGFHEIDHENRQASIGYWISASHQGKGLVTKSCKRLIDYAVDDVKLEKVIMRIAPGNTPSRRVAERCGLKPEETIKQAEWLYDHYVDLVIYRMHAKDWLARRAGK